MNFPATKVYLKLPLRENGEEFFRNNSFPSYQEKLSEMGLLLYLSSIRACYSAGMVNFSSGRCHQTREGAVVI